LDIPVTQILIRPFATYLPVGTQTKDFDLFAMGTGILILVGSTPGILG
jgi:hypothetical protein